MITRLPQTTQPRLLYPVDMWHVACLSLTVSQSRAVLISLQALRHILYMDMNTFSSSSSVF